jgi:PKD repeat protein
MPDPSFDSSSPVVLGEPMVFTNTTTSNPPATSWFWSFGDGGTSMSESPVYTYTSAGMYLVTLAASNPRGSDSDASSVTVYHWADVNFDWTVDVNDVSVVAAAWRCKVGDPCYESRYDIDGDGLITVVDILRVASQWGWSYP